MDMIQYDLNTLLYLKSKNHFQSGVVTTPEQAGYTYLFKKEHQKIIDNLIPETDLEHITFYTSFNPNISGWDVTKVEVTDKTGKTVTY
ncbi:hypothetical protein F6X50_20590 [Dickeya dianthicola]|uniref:hypothetical protein n=1 Tax=Dickeya dianthicola TaxID=204039 RepID=UPI0003D6D9DA|nr:hypothetical protein [Dickeya dianthicola]ATO34574.1 hypothetical protein DDI_3406 [Dickeya dianthicola RNS04.9]MCA7001804.1 hypothetical protein [Dickeya dianthicola]MCI4155087.1 hypothetical protein [Dickeya dianthicola]MCI4233689.1 hypothetical protein [Dickeya dianthicola]MCI4239397.1 hypothetical protein [Dickeya dianthicola]